MKTLKDKKYINEQNELAFDYKDVKEAVLDLIKINYIITHNFIEEQDEYDRLCAKYGIQFVNLDYDETLKVILGAFEK